MPLSKQTSEDDEISKIKKQNKTNNPLPSEPIDERQTSTPSSMQAAVGESQGRSEDASHRSSISR